MGRLKKWGSYAAQGFSRNANDWRVAAVGGLAAGAVVTFFGWQIMFTAVNPLIANGMIIFICVAAGELIVFGARFAWAPIHFMLEPHGGLGAFLRKKLKVETVPAIFIAIGAIGILAIGVCIGGLIGRGSTHGKTDAATPAQTTGRIAWNFDQPGDFYFLAITTLNDQEPRIVGFQAHGKNTSADPITEFSGYIRSNITNEKRPILISAQEPTKNPNRPSYIRPPQIPTPFDQTFGIPGSADFDIGTFNKPVIQSGVDGEPVSQFLRDFGPFTLVLSYDGTTTERHFSAAQINAQVALLKKQTNPTLEGIPRVTRRPTATPVELPFPFALQPPKLQAPKE